MRCAGMASWLVDGADADLAIDRQKAWLTALMLRLGELLKEAGFEGTRFVALTPEAEAKGPGLFACSAFRGD